MTEEPMLIGVSLAPNESLQNIYSESTFSQVQQDNFNMQDLLNYNLRMATGIDPLTVGIQSQGNTTATEAQQIQQNANLKLMYNNKIDFWGEEDFWIKWYKMYKQNMPNDKVIRIANPMGFNTFFLKKKDLKTKNDPAVFIKSKADAEKENQKRLQILQMVVPLLQLDPTGYGTTFAKRLMLELA